MESIIQSEKTCYVCGSPYIQVHHIYYGVKNRKISDRYGCIAYLCQAHHTGNNGVHFNIEFDRHLKEECQRAFEQKYTENFTSLFGRNYL